MEDAAANDMQDLIARARREAMARIELSKTLAAITGATVTADKWTRVAGVTLDDPVYEFALCIRLKAERSIT